MDKFKASCAAGIVLVVLAGREIVKYATLIKAADIRPE